MEILMKSILIWTKDLETDTLTDTLKFGNGVEITQNGDLN